MLIFIIVKLLQSVIIIAIFFSLQIFSYYYLVERETDIKLVELIIYTHTFTISHSPKYLLYKCLRSFTLMTVNMSYLGYVNQLHVPRVRGNDLNTTKGWLEAFAVRRYNPPVLDRHICVAAVGGERANGGA